MWGGVFALSDAAVLQFDADTANPGFESAFLGFNARSALNRLLLHLKPTKVWLPAYLCPDLLKALPPSQNWGFYALDRHLKPVATELFEKIVPGDLVLTIAYLGFAPDSNWLMQLRDLGAEIVLDASQALYLKQTDPRDYLLYSPRKWGGISDGGILIGPDLPPQPVRNLRPPPAWQKLHQAQVLRREFDDQAQPNLTLQAEWFGLFRDAEAQQPVGNWAMTDDSQARLKSLMQDPRIPLLRRKNYQRLLAKLAEWALFPALQQETVPLAFALRVRQRDALQHALAEKQIYCPIYWPLGEHVPGSFSESHTLSKQTLALPCDQRYNETDMEKILAEIKMLEHLL
ncbi:MAG: hypothetical protein IV090_21090 [Candidatus Sericytochromatia bacterium]|nr:hypothetical protein [Candidatus Sericytochromatia bacterium]